MCLEVCLMTGEGEKEFLNGREAVQYLAKRWEIESYSLGAFRVYRNRLGIEPDLGTENASFWRKETLDHIPKPKARGRPRGTRSKKQHAEEQSDEAA